MIRINLIRDRTVVTKKPVIQADVTRLGSILVIVFALNLLIFLWYGWSLKSERSKKTQQRDKLQAEHLRLQKIAQEVKEQEKLKKQLEERIEVIERLQENQTGPVDLLNKVIASLPDQLWLSALSQNGPTINVEGYFLQDDALPQFIASLERTKFFNFVDLNFYEKTETAASKFSLKCQVGKKP